MPDAADAAARLAAGLGESDGAEGGFELVMLDAAAVGSGCRSGSLDCRQTSESVEICAIRRARPAPARGDAATSEAGFGKEASGSGPGPARA